MKVVWGWKGRLGTGDTAHGLPVVLTVDARPGADERTVEAQIERVVATDRGRGPIEPVRATTAAGRARVPAPGIDEIIRELAQSGGHYCSSRGRA